jgi:hypothetical protein
MIRRLTEANFGQREEPLAEVLDLMATLLEGWEGAKKQLAAQSAAIPTLSQAPAPAEHAAGPWALAKPAIYRSQAWSF